MVFEVFMGVPDMRDLWQSLNVGAVAGTLNGEERVLAKQLAKAVKHLGTDPKHAGLQSHDIDEPTQRYGQKVFVSYLANNTPAAGRLFWVYGPNRRQITVIGLEPHPEDAKKGAYNRVRLSTMPDPITPQLRHTHTVNEVLEAADGMSTDELDRLPYGMIQLDPAGRILNYNAVESRLAALRKEDAIGKQFFTEIAPCTKVQDFYGRFKEGVIREALDTSFRFHFAFKQNPRDVTVRLLYSKRTRTVWVLISDDAGQPLAP